jgi:hypothetical protein
MRPPDTRLLGVRGFYVLVYEDGALAAAIPASCEIECSRLIVSRSHAVHVLENRKNHTRICLLMA